MDDWLQGTGGVACWSRGVCFLGRCNKTIPAFFHYFLTLSTHVKTQQTCLTVSGSSVLVFLHPFTSPGLSIPANLSAVWDPSAPLDPLAVFNAEMAVEQVALMARIVLALLAQPFGETKAPKRVTFNM